MSLKVELKTLPHFEGLNLPAYQSEEAAGVDLPAAVDTDLTLKPGERALVPTGLAMAMPKGYEAQVRPRSGLSIKHGISVVNAPGTIDSDYRGEVRVPLINLGQEDFVVERGMRIAQMVFTPVVQATFIEVAELDETDRGTGGFGSTGV